MSYGQNLIIFLDQRLIFPKGIAAFYTIQKSQEKKYESLIKKKLIIIKRKRNEVLCIVYYGD